MEGLRWATTCIVGMVLIVGLAVNLPSARADSQFINGTLKTDQDTPVPYCDITLTNTNTSESIYTQSGANGQFSFNLGNLQSGFSTGDIIQIWPSPIDGYQGYRLHTVIRPPCFVNNVYTVNPVMTQDPLSSTMVDLVGTMWVHDHDYINPGHGQDWWRNRGHVPASGHTNVETRVGWLWWDDGITGYTIGHQYQISITFIYQLWKSDNYPNGDPENGGSYVASYPIVGGIGPKQQDPFMKVTVGQNLDGIELVLRMMLATTTQHWENGQWVTILNTGPFYRTLSGVYYDF